MGYIYLHLLAPSPSIINWHSLQQLVPEIDTNLVMVVFLQEAMRTDLVGSSTSLNEPADRFKTIEDKFGPTTYAKGKNRLHRLIVLHLQRWIHFEMAIINLAAGAAIFRMVRDFVGEDAFRSAIIRYLQK